MSTEVFLALLGYAFVTSITPGPNNLMLLASGVNFGFIRTIPHMLGVGIGFFVMLLAVGFGLGAVFTAFPALHLVLKVLGSAYLLYLAWRIATTRSLAKEGKAGAVPMTFLEAAAFQWVNPKACQPQGLGDGPFGDGDLHQSRPAFSIHMDCRGGIRAGEPAQRVILGGFRHGAARLPVRPGASQMVQHCHGRAFGADALADGEIAVKTTESPAWSA